MAVAFKKPKEEPVLLEGTRVSGPAVGGVLKAAPQAKPAPSGEKQASALERQMARDDDTARKFYVGAAVVTATGIAAAAFGVALGAPVAVAALAAIVVFNFYSEYARSRKEARLEELKKG